MNGTLDPPALRRAMTLFLDGLRAHRDELNSLNVYPVPDGDTGTNLLHTQESVAAALDGAAPVDGFAADGATIASASLLGARGNSGVLLSQILRGFTERLPAHAAIAAPAEVAAALEHAGAEAYRAVGRPVEGTILTVLREASAAAVGAARAGADTTGVVDRALEAAREALARTTEVNATLRRAGVVDAGGKGVVLFLDALRASITDARLSEPVGAFGP